MERAGIRFNQAMCTGCGACQVACKDKNHTEPGLFFRRAGIFEGTESVFCYSVSCQNCKDGACIRACPYGAIQDIDGIVEINPRLCIGCGSCVWACPHGAVGLSRRLGRAVKCDFCRDLREEGKDPACVDACPLSCLTWRK